MATFQEECLQFLLQMKHVEGFKGLPQIKVFRTKEGEDLSGMNMLPLFYFHEFLDHRWKLVKLALPSGTYRLVFEFATDGADVGITDIERYPGECVGFSHIQGPTHRDTPTMLTYHAAVGY